MNSPDPSELAYLIGGGVIGVFIAAATGLIVFWVFSFVRRGGFGSLSSRASAEAGLEEFTERIAVLQSKHRVISAYSNEYFNTLQDAGWEAFSSLIEDLSTVEGSLRIMLDRGLYREVQSVCDYMMGRLSPAEGREVASHYEGLESLENWRSQSRVLLMKVIEATTTSAEELKNLGIQRNHRRRKPTLVTLADLRGSVGDV
jgi:hypothetical protein